MSCIKPEAQHTLLTQHVDTTNADDNKTSMRQLEGRSVGAEGATASWRESCSKAEQQQAAATEAAEQEWIVPRSRRRKDGTLEMRGKKGERRGGTSAGGREGCNTFACLGEAHLHLHCNNTHTHTPSMSKTHDHKIQSHKMQSHKMQSHTMQSHEMQSHKMQSQQARQS